MALQVKISSRAAKEILAAATWWVDNRPAALGAVAEDFSEAIALLAEQPGIGAKYAGTRTPGVRRLFLGRLGYFIYYKSEDNALKVLAFWHASRGNQPRI